MDTFNNHSTANLDAQTYNLSQDEFAEIINRESEIQDLADYWELVARENDDAADILDKALGFIEVLSDEDLHAAPYVALFARSLVDPEVVEAPGS